jgi:UDP:flavonoid glycosyltransferase YjiC (YdhE family)
MAKLLWLNWSGGGNLPPSLGVARVLAARGHELSFAGRPEMVPRVKTAGYRAIEITQAYSQLERYPTGSPLTRMACYLTSPAVEAQVSEIVAAEAPDLALIDCMFPAALNQASGFGRPAAVFCHTFVHRQLDMWRGMFGKLGGMRVEAGYSPLPGLDDLWRPRERLISTSLGAFDAPVRESWPNLVHVGPALEDEKAAVPTPLPWPDDDPQPLVLVSFSTGFEQRNVDKLQRALDGLANLPLRVVATTGGVVAAHELAAPANAIVLNYAAHDPILARAAAVVGHGGHGTAMRALRHGVPMAIIPGIAGDQPFVAAAVQEWGAGLALPADADAGVIGAAISRLIREPRFRQEARRRAEALGGVDGATGAADVVEAMLA